MIGYHEVQSCGEKKTLLFYFKSKDSVIYSMNSIAMSHVHSSVLMYACLRKMSLLLDKQHRVRERQ